MICNAALLNSVCVLAFSWPSFDWKHALFVGTIAAVVVAAIIVVAIATPPIAIAGGASMLGTVVAVGIISVTSGLAIGVVAGFHKGSIRDAEREELRHMISRISNRIEISFVLDDDTTQAKAFACTISTYEETGLDAQQPDVALSRTDIIVSDAAQFYRDIESHLGPWFAAPVRSDGDGLPRQVVIYMSPYPGDGVYEQIKLLAQDLAGPRKYVVSKVDGPWRSALLQLNMNAPE